MPLSGDRGGELGPLLRPPRFEPFSRDEGNHRQSSELGPVAEEAIRHLVGRGGREGMGQS